MRRGGDVAKDASSAALLGVESNLAGALHALVSQALKEIT
jgi:hypothetical protein